MTDTNVCEFKSRRFTQADEPGNEIEFIDSNDNPDTCKDDCDKYFGCHNFMYCPGKFEDGMGCRMYDKKLTEDDLLTSIGSCVTHYRECAGIAIHLL